MINTFIVKGQKMYQQKQQKHTRSETQIIKDPSKIGLLFKKSALPPIKTSTSSRSKSHHNLQQFTSPKKIKIPDIYYDQLPKPIKKKQLDTIITERDSVNQVTIDPNHQESQNHQTVMKVNLNAKPQENNHDNMREIHRQNQLNLLQSLDKRFSQAKLSLKNGKDRYCCQTQTSQQIPQINSKPKFLHHPHHSSLPQTTKHSINKILPLKLKPIKTNFYQKPELFGPVPNKLLPTLDRSQFQRYFISKNQEKNIVDKLSRPKHQHQCTKKNCQCFNESCLSNSLSPSNRGMSSFDLKQIQTKKLKINVERLKKMTVKDCPQAEEDYFEQGLKKKIQHKRNYKKNKNLISLQRFDTQPCDSQKFMKDNEGQNDQNYAESEGPENRQNVFLLTKEEDSFITGLLTPQKSTIEHDKEKGPNKMSEQKDDGFGPRKPKKVQVQIQTQDILIVKDQETHNINSTEIIKPLNLMKSLPDEDENYLGHKNYTLSQSEAKDFQEIGYTFGSRENSARKPEIHKDSDQSRIQEHFAGKTREQIMQCLTYERQYWLYYEIEKNIFNDLTKPIKKNTEPLKSKINLVSSVFKEDIVIKAPKKQEKLTEKPSLDISQISSIPNIEKLNSIPITIDIKNSKKSQFPQTNSSVLARSRNAPSPNLIKSHINMFSRSPNSIASSRARKCFRIPKQSEYVDFVKNYKPINPQIKIPVLLQQENCKVIPSISKFFFGQTIKESIKHGLGVEIMLNEIFEGEYENGNIKRGFLKVHDGFYEGTFENNLKHGHGIFRWENGQVFEGQWKMGTKNGYGVWTSPDGSYYEGQWHLNMQHGKGKHVHSSGIYEGEFKNFRKQGMGKQSFPNGDNFEGEYKNGKPNGKGKYEWKDGSHHLGEFVNGIKQGFGKYHENANTYYEGSFRKDKKHGQGIEYYKDGSYLEGVFIDGSIQEGKLYSSSKQIIKTIGGKIQ